MGGVFAKRNTKFGGGGKIGIGKRGRAKIPSPQPPSFLPARAFSFCRAKRGNQSGFCSKKVRASFSNCDTKKFRRVKGGCRKGFSLREISHPYGRSPVGMTEGTTIPPGPTKYINGSRPFKIFEWARLAPPKRGGNSPHPDKKSL